MLLAEPLVGMTFGLRSPGDEDAAFTVELRSDAERSRFLHRGAEHEAGQRDWTTRALARDNDVPLVVYRVSDGAREGTAGVYDIDFSLRQAEWGRWVLRRGSTAAVESTLLVYTLAFELLELDLVYCRTLRGNESVVSFHDSAGLMRDGSGIMNVDGRPEPYVRHVLARSDWERVRARLRPLAEAVARRAR